MKTLGSIRRIDCVEAEIVLTSGVYLTFRLDSRSRTLRDLIETDRRRMHMQPRQSVPVDAYTLQLARRAALEAILAHREKMTLRAKKENRSRQLRLI